jgi:hypothetical protein
MKRLLVRVTLVVVLLICSTVLFVGSVISEGTAPVESITSQYIQTKLPEEYQDYEVLDVLSEEGWAYFSLIKLSPISGENTDRSITHFRIGVAEYVELHQEWFVYIERSPEFFNALERLPDWLKWLTLLFEQMDLFPPNTDEAHHVNA